MKGTEDSISDKKKVLERLKRPFRMKHYWELQTKFSHKCRISQDTTAGLFINIASSGEI